MLVTNPVSQAGTSHLHVIVQQVQSQQLAINEGCGNSSRGLKTNTDSWVTHFKERSDTKCSRKPSFTLTEHSKMTDFFFFFASHNKPVQFLGGNKVSLHLPLLFSYAHESGLLKVKLNRSFFYLFYFLPSAELQLRPLHHSKASLPLPKTPSSASASATLEQSPKISQGGNKRVIKKKAVKL